MARKMLTKAERKNKVSPFLSKAWMERKENKAIRVKNLEVTASWRKSDKYEDHPKTP